MWFRLILQDKIGFMFSRLRGISEMCEDFEMQEAPRCWTSNTLPLSSILNKTIKEDRKSKKLSSVCVCVFVPLWWSVCRSCCRSLISARIWGHGVSHSAPSPGFYLPRSGSDLELWTTDGEKTESVLHLLCVPKCTKVVMFPQSKTCFPISPVTSCIPPTCLKIIRVWKNRMMKPNYSNDFLSDTRTQFRQKSISLIIIRTIFASKM